MYYFLFMALLTITLILWAIVAIREDGAGNDPPSDKDQQ